MKIGLAGPVRTDLLGPWLDEDGDFPPGLGGTPVTLLAIGLLRAGHEVSIASLDRTVEDDVVLRGPGLTVRLERYRPRHRARDAFAAERKAVARAISADEPDIVHAHWSYEFALGALACGPPVVVTVRDWAPTMLRLEPTPYRAVRLAMNAAVLARARHFTATSPYIERRLRRWVRGDVHLIPNAVDDEKFTARSRPPDPARVRILAVNNGFSKRKNVATLLEAFAALRRNRPGWRLRLVGEGYGPGEAAHRYARKHGLDAGVEFVGSVPYGRLDDQFHDADLLVHPALEESFGMVLIEAMARGLPVLGGASSGAVPWVLDHGKAGALTDVTSAARLASAIEQLVVSDVTWHEYSSAGFAHARHKFTVSAAVDAYVGLYRSVLKTNDTRQRQRAVRGTQP